MTARRGLPYREPREAIKRAKQDGELTSVQAGRLAGSLMAKTQFDVRDGTGCLGFIARGTSSLLEIGSAAGTWSITKPRALGWELLITSIDGRHAGWYVGRRWRSGGTIFIADHTEADLQRSLTRGWRVRLDDGSPLAEIKPKGRSQLLLRLSPQVTELADADLIVLTACSVVLLEVGLRVPGTIS